MDKKRNIIVIIDKKENVLEFSLKSKVEVAQDIFNEIRFVERNVFVKKCRIRIL